MYMGSPCIEGRLVAADACCSGDSTVPLLLTSLHGRMEVPAEQQGISMATFPVLSAPGGRMQRPHLKALLVRGQLAIGVHMRKPLRLFWLCPAPPPGAR